MGEIDDVVMTYTGMRTVTTRNGQVLLNFRPLYQRLVLDQGYWKDGLLTGTPDEIERDLDLVKKMGFNGVRKHQKFESPWFYYQADVKGVLVWAELPSAYEFCFSEIENLTEDMIGAVQRLYNHPSIVTWVPLNESWGVRDIFFNESMQHFSVGLYHLLKALDPNRLVSVNDGWEQTVSDISALHDYMSTDEASLRKRWGDEEAVEKTAVSNRQSYASGYSKGDAPLLITEFGGTALAPDAVGGAWGYRNPAANKEELLSRISSIVRAIRNDGSIKGFCYTQLTDVMQEVNGLLDENHVPKCPVEDYSRIFGEEN